MLTFSQTQMSTFHNSWQIEQLRTRMPAMLRQIEEKFPQAYASAAEQAHRHYIETFIEQVSAYGFTKVDHLQQLLALQYQSDGNLFGQKNILPLLQARQLDPQDRIDCIGYLADLPHGLAAYGSLEGTSLEQRAAQIQQETAKRYPQESPGRYFIQTLRQALYLALLNHLLPGGDNWRSWQSDWRQARIGIEQRQYRRRIQLQTAEEPRLQAKIETDEAQSTLMLQIPDRLDRKQRFQLRDSLQNWAVDLLSIKQMQASFMLWDA